MYSFFVCMLTLIIKYIFHGDNFTEICRKIFKVLSEIKVRTLNKIVTIYEKKNASISSWDQFKLLRWTPQRGVRVSNLEPLDQLRLSGEFDPH